MHAWSPFTFEQNLANLTQNVLLFRTSYTYMKGLSKNSEQYTLILHYNDERVKRRHLYKYLSCLESCQSFRVFHSGVVSCTKPWLITSCADSDSFHCTTQQRQKFTLCISTVLVINHSESLTCSNSSKSLLQQFLFLLFLPAYTWIWSADQIAQNVHIWLIKRENL